MLLIYNENPIDTISFKTKSQIVQIKAPFQQIKILIENMPVCVSVCLYTFTYLKTKEIEQKKLQEINNYQYVLGFYAMCMSECGVQQRASFVITRLFIIQFYQYAALQRRVFSLAFQLNI